MKQWILGTEYDLNKHEDQLKLMDYIDERKKAAAANDLSMICYGLLSLLVELNGRKEQ